MARAAVSRLPARREIIAMAYLFRFGIVAVLTILALPVQPTAENLHIRADTQHDNSDAGPSEGLCASAPRLCHSTHAMAWAIQAKFSFGVGAIAAWFPAPAAREEFPVTSGVLPAAPASNRTSEPAVAELPPLPQSRKPEALVPTGGTLTLADRQLPWRP